MFQAYKLGEPLPRQIAVVRALRGLGDMLCLVPALRALRAALPEGQISFVGLPNMRDLVERFNNYLDEWLEFPGFPGIPEREADLDRLGQFMNDMREREFDLSLQMHGSGVLSNPFTAFVGARRQAGFFLPSFYCPDRERFLPYPSHEPEVWRHLRLMEFLGVPLKGDYLEFPVHEKERTRMQTMLAAQGLNPGEYACLHPGAAEPRRRWTLEGMAAVADGLATRGLQVVLTGTAEEKELTQAVANRMQAPAVDLAGETTVGTLGALLEQAALLVSNDTGISHLADALRVPSVVIFVGSDPDRWGPLDRKLHRRVGRPTQETACAACRETFERHCLRDGCFTLEGDLFSLPRETIRPEQVLAEVDSLLAEVQHAA